MPRARFISLDKLHSSATTWLWPKHIPSSCLVSFDGDPGCGKSLVSIDLAARLSRGDALPDGAPLDRPRRTLLLNAEDDFEETIRPRLVAAGANLEHILTMRSEAGHLGSGALRLPRDVKCLARIVRRQQIDLIVIDPLVAFLEEGISVNYDQAVRRALQPLTDMNQSTHSTTLMVRHLNKNAGQKALYRGSGSIGIVGTARAGLLAAAHPHRKGCYLLTTNKLNAGEKPPAQIYRIATAQPPHPSPLPRNGGEGVDPSSSLSPALRGEGRGEGSSCWGEGPCIARIEWLGVEDMTADAALNPDERDAPGLFRAMGWLRSKLRDGPRLASEIILEATAAGISERTLERAKHQARVQSHFQRINGERSWIWADDDYKDERTLELERLLGPAPPLEETDTHIQAQLSQAGRDILTREKFEWAEGVLKDQAKRAKLGR